MKTVNIQIPDGVTEFLHAMHDTHEVGDKQSMRNGTSGHIPFLDQPKPIRKLMRAMNAALGGLIGNDSWGYVGIWSTRLPKEGFHVAHNHPQGWMSGIIYIDVPSSEGGLLEFENSFLIPQTGDVVLFPSETIHGVTKYEGDKPRLTVAFDLLKMEAQRAA